MGIGAISTHRANAVETYNKRADALRQRYARDAGFRAKLNADLALARRATKEDVHASTFLSNISVYYANGNHIAEQVLPVVGVEKYSDIIPKFSRRQLANTPDDSMQERSRANELSREYEPVPYSLRKYGYEDFVSDEQIEGQDLPFNVMLDSLEIILDTLSTRREKRAAALVTTAGNYAGNTSTLSGSDQWNSSTGGNPVKDIVGAKRACWTGRGPGRFVGVCSEEVWAALVTNPVVMDLYKHTNSSVLKPSELAMKLGLDDILVSSVREDIANANQTESLAYVWGKHFAVLRVASTPSLRNASFGYTLRKTSSPKVSQWFDQGADGMYNKAVFWETPVVTAGETGFLLVNAIA